MISDARKRADLEFKKKMIKQVSLSLHKTNDADIIEFLDKVENKRQYLMVSIFFARFFNSARLISIFTSNLYSTSNPFYIIYQLS